MRAKLLLVAGLVAFAGLVAGPGYYFFSLFSGEEVGRFPGQAPFTVELDPAMNPISFTWQGRLGPGSTRSRNAYTASLYLGDKLVMRQAVWISRGESRISRGEPMQSDSWKWSSLGFVGVPQRGVYRFVLEEGARPGLRVSDVEIKVRRNAREPDVTWLMAGNSVSLAAFLSMFLILLRAPPPKPPLLEYTIADGGVQRVIRDYAVALMPFKELGAVVTDLRFLPHPKPRIKQALAAALRQESDRRARKALEFAYRALAFWQEGVGDAPVHGAKLSTVLNKERRERLRRWFAVVDAEDAVLRAELKRLRSG